MRNVILGTTVLLGVLVAPSSVAGQGAEDKEIAGKKLKQWIADTHHQDPGVRETAIRAISLYGKDGRKAGKRLVVELRDPDPSLRSNAAVAIAAVGLDKEDADEGIKQLGKLVQSDPQASVRVQAALALATFGLDAKPAVPQLIYPLRDSQISWEVRRAAAMALGATALDPKDGPNPQAITALSTAVKSDSCAKVRLHALTSLILLGRGAPPTDSDGEKSALRKAQADALRTEKAVLEGAVRDQDKMVSLWARVALMRVDKVSEANLIQIGLMLKSADIALRLNAVQALGAMGPEAKSQIPHLTAALKDSDPAVASAAAAALAGMGDDAQAAVPTLRELAAGKDEVVKLAAKEAINRITNTDKKQAKPAPKQPD